MLLLIRHSASDSQVVDRQGILIVPHALSLKDYKDSVANMAILSLAAESTWLWTLLFALCPSWSVI